MKNKIKPVFIVLVVLLISISTPRFLKAQSEFGVKGGILFSNINASNNNSNVEIGKRDGVVLGAFYKKNNILGPVGFKTELLYQSKGANYFIENTEAPLIYNTDEFGIDNTNSYYRSEEKLHYLSVPLILEVATTNFLDIYAGPEIGYLVSQQTDRQETDELNRFSAGVVMGATLRLCENTKLDFRYSTDFTAFDKLGKNNSVDMKNNGFTITIQQTIFIK